MTRLIHALALVSLSLLCEILFLGPVAARHITPRSLNSKRHEAVKRWEALGRRANITRRGTDGATPSPKNITFANPEASKFYVDGTSIPLVDFDVGSSWSGLIPISAAPNETRKLFFWFFPPGPEGTQDDLILWYIVNLYDGFGRLTGGPGCSSLAALLLENGPFIWQNGLAPIQNLWSWTNLSSVLYIEQPVGTGFSQGQPDAKDENDVAVQLVGFLKQFLEIFSELKGKKFYIAGESYAGMYVPYTANYIYENTARSTFDLDLQGIWMNDPVIGWDVSNNQIPAVDFVHEYEHVFAFNQTFLTYLDSVAATCNYSGYMNKYVTYPPQGPLPLPGTSTKYDPGCDVYDEIVTAALLVNPAFDVFHIFDTLPMSVDVLGISGSNILPSSQSNPLYFDRADVKAAIHAPADFNWSTCVDDPTQVFPQGDASLPPAFTVLPNVIEKNNRSVIAHGLIDFVLIPNGTRIALQNMTWGGKQGFQTRIATDSFNLDGVGALGTMKSERGLTYVEIELAGHMLPEYSPVAAFQIMEYLLGHREGP